MSSSKRAAVSSSDNDVLVFVNDDAEDWPYINKESDCAELTAKEGNSNREFVLFWMVCFVVEMRSGLL